MLITAVERAGILVASFMATLALFPSYGQDNIPTEHFSIYGNPVPGFSPWPGIGLGLLTLAVLELVRRRVHRDANR